jgi:Polysaccharide pyruvyl transferase
MSAGRGMKTLLVGWFSFESMGATAGDLLARDVALAWLNDAGHDVDTAAAPPFVGDVRLERIDSAQYSHVVFVCGPFGNGPPIDAFLARFEHAKLVGLDLSLIEPLEVWNPFDLLVERDSSRAAHPDLSFASAPPEVPVVGISLVHPQEEYGNRGLHSIANRTIEEVAAGLECARIHIDTRLDDNASILRTAAEVYAIIRKVDVMLTTRLHGLVLSLKASVPVVALDPIAGGAKLTRQANTLQWPWCFPADTPVSVIRHAVVECLDEAEHQRTRATADSARDAIERIRKEFIERLGEL